MKYIIQKIIEAKDIRELLQKESSGKIISGRIIFIEEKKEEEIKDMGFKFKDK